MPSGCGADADRVSHLADGARRIGTQRVIDRCDPGGNVVFIAACQQTAHGVAQILFVQCSPARDGKLTRARTAAAADAQQHGCVVGIDLAHATGNAPLSLHDWNVDFAVWCSYKYLNAGPGAVSGVYIHAKYANDRNHRRMGGWWGNAEKTRFKMEK